jgi:hypothetical protein
MLMAASKSNVLGQCLFDDGILRKDMSTELNDILDETTQPGGWTSIYDVQYITLNITMVRDGNGMPLIVKEEDRVAVASHAAATTEEDRAAVATD